MLELARAWTVIRQSAHKARRSSPGEARDLRCAQYGRAAPTDPDLLQAWPHGALMAEPVDELLAKILLCPAPVAGDLARDFESAPVD